MTRAASARVARELAPEDAIAAALGRLSPRQRAAPGRGAGEAALLDGFAAAFEADDPDALSHVLAPDARVSIHWPDGRRGRVPAIAAVLVPQTRLIPTRANGRPAFGWYLRERALGMMVLTVAADRVVAVAVFADPRLVSLFGLPPVLDH